MLNRVSLALAFGFCFYQDTGSLSAIDFVPVYTNLELRLIVHHMHVTNYFEDLTYFNNKKLR